MLGCQLFPVELQRIHHRPVTDRKKNRLVVRKIFMPVPLPKRHDESVALFPLEIAVADLGSADDG